MEILIICGIIVVACVSMLIYILTHNENKKTTQNPKKTVNLKNAQICYHCGKAFTDIYSKTGSTTGEQIKKNLCPKCRRNRILLNILISLGVAFIYAIVVNLLRVQGVLLGAIPTAILMGVLIAIVTAITNSVYSKEPSVKYMQVKNDKSDSESSTFKSFNICESVVQGSNLLVSFGDKPGCCYVISIYYQNNLIKKHKLTSNSSGFVYFECPIDDTAKIGVYDVIIKSDSNKTYKSKFTVTTK